MLHIGSVLDEATRQVLVEALSEDAFFRDGRETAGAVARPVKNNGQIARGARHAVLSKAVETALRRHRLFMAAVRPRGFARLLFSRYGPGQAYGRHLDEPIIAGQRTDLSFTLFLNDPAAYDGGALVVEDRDGESEIKMPAGGLVLYPSTALHQVTPVTRGVRLACVGWVRSLIRLEAHRDILLDLETAADAVWRRDGASETHAQITRARDNLIRLWAED